ncbi:MAG: PKD domain-containing protein [Draconibacterium sp.]
MNLKHKLYVFLMATLFFACNNDNDLQGPLQLPTPEFSADKTEATDGQVIQFSDQSENALGWKWDFGDGSENSFEQNPGHSYVYGGKYTITLTVWNNDGENLLTKENYISIDGPEKEKPSLPDLFSYTVVTTSDHEISGLPGFVGKIYVNDELFTTIASAATEMTIPASFFSGNQDIVFYKGEWTDDARVLSIGNNSVEKTDIVALNYVSDIKKFFGRKLTSLAVVNENFFTNCPDLVNLEAAFRGCTALTEIPVNLFTNNPEITSFKHTFADCRFEQIPAGLFKNNTKVTSFNCTFNVNTSMKEIPEGLFDNCPLVTDYAYAFYKNAKLTTIPASLFDNNPNVTTFEGCFAACDIQTIPANFFDKCTKVTNFKSVFNLNKTIKEIPEALFDKCTAVTTFGFAFYACTGLETAPELWNKTMFTALSTTDGCFRGCDQVSNFADIPANWK